MACLQQGGSCRLCKVAQGVHSFNIHENSKQVSAQPQMLGKHSHTESSQANYDRVVRCAGTSARPVRGKVHVWDGRPSGAWASV